MNKNKINKIVYIYLILSPFIDVITSFQVRHNVSTISFGQMVRGLFFLLMFIYCYKNTNKKKYLLILLAYLLLNLFNVIAYTENNIITELVNMMLIFYLPISILFFNNLDEEFFNDKILIKLFLIYSSLIIIPYIFKIGYNAYPDYDNKQGFLGLFNSGNELSSLFIGFLPIVLEYIFKSKNYILKIISYISIILVTYLIGTKTLLLGVLIVFIYYGCKYLIKNNKNIQLKIKILSVFIIISIIGSTIIFLPKSAFYNNLKITLGYYKIEKVSDLFNYENVDNVIFSKRLTYLSNINNKYKSSRLNKKVFGLGKEELMKLKDIEIDIFDIFYSIGLLGITIYIFLIIIFLKNNKIVGKYKFSLILFLLISLLTGHVLIRPNVSIYIALLFLLSTKKETDKKKILLVSNMYPNKKYKFFGSFVKNTEELLKENNFDVDKVVKYKEVTKINKIISYLLFYTKSFFKVILNNYDYIYVHFASHSCQGIILPLKFTKDIKLVINVHGNDVVADYDFEEKNIRKSKKYLKYAYKIIVPSNYFKKIIINDYNISKEKIIVYSSGGVDTEKFKKIDMNIAKKECGLNEKYEYIGYISRIEKNKGYDIFLKAIKELEVENKIGNKKFLIVGTGNEEQEMQKIIKELDLMQYLEVRNMVSQDELVNIYNSLEIFVFPTYRKSESLGLVGLEAMACETFVIASNNYGPTDYAINEKNSLLFKPKDEIDLKNRILQYYKLNNEQKKKIYKKERETALKYDSKNTISQLLEVFK